MGNALGSPRQAVPVINIAPFVNEADYSDDERKAVAAQWDQAMTDIGFAIIKGHGVAPEVISNLRDGAMAFFSKDTESKLAFRHGEIGNPDGGWQGMGLESVSRTRDMLGSDGGANLSKALPDLLESYNFKWDSDKPRPVEMDEPGQVYKDEMLRVLSCINHLTALALGLPRDFFDPYYKPCAQTDFRLAYYPPVPKHAQSTSAMRFGEHTDYTGYTILHQDETDIGELDTGGLQVKLNGEWQAVKPQKGTFIVNIGDLYEIWTNGRWRSTVHRVMKPPAGSAAASNPRLSLPFFTGPHGDALIEAIPTCVDENHPARYEPVKAFDHLMKKIKQSNA